MNRLAAVLALFFLAAWSPVETILRPALYPFDDTRVAPATVGLPQVQEVSLGEAEHQVIVWIAKPEPGKPVIFYLHGNAGNLANRAGRFRRFLDQGYGLIAPAYPGSSGSAGTPSKDLISRTMVGVWVQQSDLLPTVYNFPLPGVPAPPKVVIYGESLGAAVAISLVASPGSDWVKGVGTPDAVILEAPFTSLKDVGKHAYPGFAETLEKLPDIWPSLRWAGSLRMPLLVIHGTEDALIPIEQGRQIFSAAPTQDKTFLAVQGAGHSDLWRTDTLPQLWRFIDR